MKIKTIDGKVGAGHTVKSLCHFRQLTQEGQAVVLKFPEGKYYSPLAVKALLNKIIDEVVDVGGLNESYLMDFLLDLKEKSL